MIEAAGAASPSSDYIVFVDESGDHSLDVINPDYPVFVAVQGNGLKVFP